MAFLLSSLHDFFFECCLIMCYWTFFVISYGRSIKFSQYRGMATHEQASLLRALGLMTWTPLIPSKQLEVLCGRRVFLKLDCLQPSGSFKDRGMAHLAATALNLYHEQLESDQKRDVRFIASSGGNAGLAIATVARTLNAPVECFLPTTTKQKVINKLQELGAAVTVTGANWNDADRVARERVASLNQDESACRAVYVSPYDNPLLWAGHATMWTEVVHDLLKDQDGNLVRPAAVIASVGGGGLLAGLIDGIRSQEKGTYVPTVIAAETIGCDCLNRALRTGSPCEGRLVAIESLATSLGALEIAEGTFSRVSNISRVYSLRCDAENFARTEARPKMASCDQDRQGTTIQCLVSSVCRDKDAVEAVFRFAQHHSPEVLLDNAAAKVAPIPLVEPACGAALACLYNDLIREEILKVIADEEERSGATTAGAIIVEVCGGNGVSLDLLEEWCDSLGIEFR